MSTTPRYAEHEITADQRRLIAFGLHQVFEAAQKTSTDPLAQGALFVTGMVAKRLNDLMHARVETAGLDGMRWHPAQSGDLAGVLQVQEHTFGHSLLPQVLNAAVQALLALDDQAIGAIVKKSVYGWADDYTSAEVKAEGFAAERARITADKHAAVRLLSEFAECC